MNTTTTEDRSPKRDNYISTTQSTTSETKNHSLSSPMPRVFEAPIEEGPSNVPSFNVWGTSSSC